MKSVLGRFFFIAFLNLTALELEAFADKTLPVVHQEACPLLEHKFPATSFKRVIFKGSGRVVIKALPVSVAHLSVKVSGSVKDFKILQARGGETLVVEQVEKKGSAEACCELHLPPELSVFVSGGSIHLSVDGMHGGQLSVQAGSFKGQGASQLKLFRGSFGKAQIDFKELVGNCEISCGEGDISLSYSPSFIKNSHKKPPVVAVRQGKGSCTLWVCKECRVFFPKHDSIQSDLPYYKGSCHLRFLTYSPWQECKVFVKALS